MMRKGFLDLGQMGSAMAAKLREAGFDVTVCSHSVDKALPLAGQGATPAATEKDSGQ